MHWWRTFGRHLWRHFREDRSFEAAGSLSYTTLLALVPLMAVMLGVISAFPVFDRWAEELEVYIFTHFVPAAGDVVREYVHNFVDNTAGLTGAGTIFLIATAILLMSTIERSLNRIWRVRSPRHLSSRIVTYWAVLTLGPMLMGASLALTSYLAALPLMAPEVVRGAMQTLVLNLTPFIVALISFTLLFLVVPNRRVRVQHALIGALLSALMFELAKRGFVFYVTHFPTYERLYGALAAIPLFLVWIYLSWVVVLLGASVSAALTTFNYRHVDWRWPRRHELLLALRVMGHLWDAQRRGESLSETELLALEPAATDSQLQRILGYFRARRMVRRDGDGDWLLTCDLEEVTLRELYQAGPFILPVGTLEDLPSDHGRDRALAADLRSLESAAEPLLNRPLKRLLERPTEDHE